MAGSRLLFSPGEERPGTILPSSRAPSLFIASSCDDAVRASRYGKWRRPAAAVQISARGTWRCASRYALYRAARSARAAPVRADRTSRQASPGEAGPGERLSSQAAPGGGSSTITWALTPPMPKLLTAATRFPSGQGMASAATFTFRRSQSICGLGVLKWRLGGIVP